jgi:hypothetical protein
MKPAKQTARVAKKSDARVRRRKRTERDLISKAEQAAKRLARLQASLKTAPPQIRARAKAIIFLTLAELVRVQNDAESEFEPLEEVVVSGSRMAKDETCATQDISAKPISVAEALQLLSIEDRSTVNVTYRVTHDPSKTEKHAESKGFMDEDKANRPKQHQRKGKLPFPELDHRAEANRTGVKLGVRVDPELVVQIRKAAEAEGIPQTEWVERAIRAALD